MKSVTATNPKRKDFREFLFGATGADTDLSKFDLIDLYDNLAAELDELAAVGEMLFCATDIDAQVLAGVGQMLKRIYRRSRAMLEIALEQGRKPGSATDTR